MIGIGTRLRGLLLRQGQTLTAATSGPVTPALPAFGNIRTDTIQSRRYRYAWNVPSGVTGIDRYEVQSIIGATQASVALPSASAVSETTRDTRSLFFNSLSSSQVWISVRVRALNTSREPITQWSPVLTRRFVGR